jgi:hypothetical protein
MRFGWHTCACSVQHGTLQLSSDNGAVDLPSKATPRTLTRSLLAASARISSSLLPQRAARIASRGFAAPNGLLWSREGVSRNCSAVDNHQPHAGLRINERSRTFAPERRSCSAFFAAVSSLRANERKRVIHVGYAVTVCESESKLVAGCRHLPGFEV